MRVCAHDTGIDTTTHTPMTTEHIMRTHIDAAECLEAAERELSIAGYRIETRAIGVALRYQVEDSRRYRTALEAPEATQAAFDAAQNIDCPDAQL